MPGVGFGLFFRVRPACLRHRWHQHNVGLCFQRVALSRNDPAASRHNTSNKQLSKLHCVGAVDTVAHFAFGKASTSNFLSTVSRQDTLHCPCIPDKVSQHLSVLPAWCLLHATRHIYPPRIQLTNRLHEILRTQTTSHNHLQRPSSVPNHGPRCSPVKRYPGPTRSLAHSRVNQYPLDH